ncbi:MAG: DUF2065 domain-containing protein [Gammaproteobacteria bacterium]|jgi:uncharacterized protein YjeT (DUF2065 family)
MQWSDLWAAFALYLVLEGLLPFASPRSWREALLTIAELDDGRVRRIGLTSMLAGLALLYFVRY